MSTTTRTASADRVTLAALDAVEILTDALTELASSLDSGEDLDPAGVAAVLVEAAKLTKKIARLKAGLTAPRPATAGRTG